MHPCAYVVHMEARHQHSVSYLFFKDRFPLWPGTHWLVKPGRLAMSSRNQPGSALPVLVLEACLAFVWVPEIRTEVLTLVCQCFSHWAVCFLSDKSLGWNYVKVLLCTCACLRCLCMCAYMCTHERARTCMCATNHYVNIVIHSLGIDRVLVTCRPSVPCFK